MPLRCSVFLCLVVISSCCAQTNTTRARIKQSNPPDRNPQYFPVGIFSRFPQLSELRARWYASELRDMEEPTLRLHNAKLGTSVYRFLLIPPFTPSLAVRVMVNPDGTANLLAKLGTKRSRDGVPREQEVVLTPEQVSTFSHLLHEAHFWSLPSGKPEAIGVPFFADAKEWLLEANKSGRYHVVDRADGFIEVSFSQVCEYLLEISPLKAQTGYRTRSTIPQSLPTPD
jgi:hypothetical protein